MAASLIPSAASVILYINGEPYAAAMSFSWSSDTPSRQIRGIDSSLPYELAPTVMSIRGQIGLLRLVGDGGIEGIGASPGASGLPRDKYFSIALIHRRTDTQLFRADRCRVQTQNWSVPNKGVMEGSMTFEAIAWNNESGR